MNHGEVTPAREKDRFEFGENWAQFLSLLDDDRIQRAEASLVASLGTECIRNKRFLDAGSGSGLFSLAARRLGAIVHSFDYDRQSVSCTDELRHRFFSDDPDWVVEQGSVLDRDYLEGLGMWDVVYSWGVLHHTGDLRGALENVSSLVKDGGTLMVAIYNDQGWASKVWLWIKQLYNRLPRRLRWVVLWPAAVRLWGPTMIRDLVSGRPFETWKTYGSQRGMSPWRDVVDWVGGLPFEVATPAEIERFFEERGFHLRRSKTCGRGRGCNEFVFSR